MGEQQWQHEKTRLEHRIHYLDTVLAEGKKVNEACHAKILELQAQVHKQGLVIDALTRQTGTMAVTNMQLREMLVELGIPVYMPKEGEGATAEELSELVPFQRQAVERKKQLRMQIELLQQELIGLSDLPEDTPAALESPALPHTGSASGSAPSVP